MSAIVQTSDAPSFLAPAPAFMFFELAISGQVVDFSVFDELGGGWYEFKKQEELDFYAPGWCGGYSEEDVVRTPVMVREERYTAMGVVW